MTDLLANLDYFWEKELLVKSWRESNGKKIFYEVALDENTTSPSINQYGRHPTDDSLLKCIHVAPDRAVFSVCPNYRSHKNAVWGLVAKSIQQHCAIDALLSSKLTCIFGSIGAGKRILSLAAGLTQCIDHRVYKEIVWTSAHILETTKEELNRIQRNVEDRLLKLESLAPEMATGEWGRAATHELVRSRVKCRTIREICGSWISNSVVVMDNIERASEEEAFELFDRVGEGSKLILIADVRGDGDPSFERIVESNTALKKLANQLEFSKVWLPRSESSRFHDS